MIFKKEELDEFPLSERLRIEKAKAQLNPTYWINEYISSHVPTADGVVSLVDYSKDITGQLESLYGDLETVLNKYGVDSLDDLMGYIESLKDQVESLYSEKEELIQTFPDVNDLSEFKELALGMEEQLKSIYSEKDMQE
ncbi:MAG: hypothetical protein KDK36_13395 [Leptospiraceae bacterium]|nr:hypothetical protein [Leptospiraceae bacterium]